MRHNWELNQLTIFRGSRKVKVALRERRQLNSAVWSVIAETMNMMEGFEDDEEEQFLRDNAGLILLVTVDVAFIVAEYMKPSPAVCLTAADAGKMLRENMMAVDGFEPEDNLKTIL